jgi:peroxiredoxin
MQKRQSLLRFVAFVLLCLGGQLCGAAEVAVGKPAPEITARTLDGSTIRIAGASGKVTIVNFWATWCAPCREEMPAIQAYYDKHKAEGLQVLAISMDKPGATADVKRIAQSFTYPIAMKSDADFKGLGRIWRMPSTFIIDRKGILRRNGHEGEPTVDLATLEATVTPLLAAR